MTYYKGDIAKDARSKKILIVDDVTLSDIFLQSC